MRRITADEVAIAVYKTGARLQPGVTWMLPIHGGQPCGCPLGVLSVSGLYNPPPYLELTDAADHLGLDLSYARCFAAGFDDVFDPDLLDGLSPEDPIRLGYEDGRKVSDELLDASTTAGV